MNGHRDDRKMITERQNPSLLGGSKNGTSELMYRTETDSDMENTGGRGGGVS